MMDMPIPGENFTSDTKSYPWHQPPEFTSIGPALEKMSQKMTDRKTAPLLMSMVETGLPLYKVSQIIIMEGMANGKWTLDLGLLLAGPITKILEIMCNVYEVEYNLGIEEEDDEPTGKFARGIIDMEKASSDRGVLKLVRDEMPKIEATAEDQETPEGGEGTVPPEKEEEDLGQEGFTTMMGGNTDEEENVGDTK
jgi:hypothetical protein